MYSNRRTGIASLAAVVALAATTVWSRPAHATGEVEVEGTGKGIAGGALLGAEIVLATEAAFKVQPAWAYVVGGLGGAAAGGVGGYFIEQNAEPRIPLVMLAAGLGFVIPTTVLVLSQTAYEPPADYLQDQAPIDEPVAEPPRPSDTPSPGVSPAPVLPSPGPATTPPDVPPVTPAPGPSGKLRTRSRERLSLMRPPPALIGGSTEYLALGVPAVELRHTYTRTEIAMFGAPDVTEVRIPVLNFVF